LSEGLSVDLDGWFVKNKNSLESKENVAVEDTTDVEDRRLRASLGLLQGLICPEIK
jgi:hypothetical protein